MFQVWLGKRVEIKVSYRIKLQFYFQVASGLPAEGYLKTICYRSLLPGCKANRAIHSAICSASAACRGWPVIQD